MYSRVTIIHFRVNLINLRTQQTNRKRLTQYQIRKITKLQMILLILIMWGKLRKKSLKMCKVNSKIVYLVLIYSFSRKTKNGASTTQVRLACFSFYKSLSQYFLVKSIREGFLCQRRHQVEEAHAWVLGVLTSHSPARLEYLAAAGLSHWCPVLGLWVRGRRLHTCNRG